MGQRHKQHHGRSEGDDQAIPGRDMPGTTEVRSETVAKNEEARDISRAIDENEGFDRKEPRRAKGRGR